jgi:hypothetical protein
MPRCTEAPTLITASHSSNSRESREFDKKE